MSHVRRDSCPIHTIYQINLKWNSYSVNGTKVFCPHVKMDEIFCSASTQHRSEATKTLKCTFEHAQIEALSPPWSRLPDFSYCRLKVVTFTRKRLLLFLIYLECQAVIRTLRKKKDKTQYFSWSDDEVDPCIAVKDLNYSLFVDFCHTCYKVRYLTPSMQLHVNLISWTTKNT